MPRVFRHTPPAPPADADLRQIPTSVVIRRPVRLYAAIARPTERAVREAVASASNVLPGTVCGRVTVIAHVAGGYSIVQTRDGGDAYRVIGTVSLLQAIAPRCDLCGERARLVVRRAGWAGPPAELCPECAEVPGYTVGLLVASDGAIRGLGVQPSACMKADVPETAAIRA